ncbi:MAG: glycosyltransferase [Candidatus Aminicenantes bacterium]|nr:MAG: glycosyltransferase [Candidatus Aminicenantes bacterium]
MNEKTILTPKAYKRMDEIKEADILVGIPSYNNENTIGHVIKAVRLGLTKYFPKYKSVIVNSDCGSTDKTRKIVKQDLNDYEELETILIAHEMHPYMRSLHTPISEMVTTFRGTPGKGKAFRRIFEIAHKLGVQAVVVVDSDLRSITPEWIQLLAAPIVFKGFDYVAPLYARHKYDGTITNSLIYPLARALYGKKIRQPIGGEFGFSAKVLNEYMKKDIWDTDVAYYGIDIWMTSVALANGFKICQSFLGAKIHNPKNIATLTPMFKQVIGTIFSLIEETHDKWKGIKGSEDLPTFGFQARVIPEEVPQDFNNLFKRFQKGIEKRKAVWEEILKSENHKSLEQMAAQPKKDYSFPNELWVKIIYDYIIFYHRFKNVFMEMSLPSVLESMVPLYFGFTSSFVLKTKNMSNLEAEKEIENICLEFERLKPYLVKNWNKKD